MPNFDILARIRKSKVSTGINVRDKWTISWENRLYRVCFILNSFVLKEAIDWMAFAHIFL